jgi:large subunit ribosomal protein L29
MASESLKEFRKMAVDELKERAENLRKDLFKLKNQAATEKVQDVSQFRKIKKDIARILTILRQQELKKA